MNKLMQWFYKVTAQSDGERAILAEEAVSVPQNREEPSRFRTDSSTPDLSWASLLSSSDPALTIPAVYRCVAVLSASLAQLPLYYRVLKGGTFVIDHSERLNYLLNVMPDPHKDAYRFKEEMTSQILLLGNAYAVPVYSREAPEIEKIVLCSPNTVSHHLDSDTYEVNDPYNNLHGTFMCDEILHFVNIAPDGRHGVSVISYAATTLKSARTAELEQLRRYTNGGTVRMLVSDSGKSQGYANVYSNEQIREQTRDMDKRINYLGENIVAMPGTLTATPISMTSADMQFLESRKLTVRDICRFFGVHPSYVFDDTSNNYKSAENASAAFLSTTLNPLLTKIEVQMLAKLVSPRLAHKRKFTFDRANTYALDPESKAKYYQAMIGSGVMTVNEARQREDMPPVADGDTLLVSANLTTIDNLKSKNDLVSDGNTGTQI